MDESNVTFQHATTHNEYMGHDGQWPTGCVSIYYELRTRYPFKVIIQAYGTLKESGNLLFEKIKQPNLSNINF